MTQDSAVTQWFERACAKVNLGLKVLGRRPDGYHDILSIMQSVDVADELHFEAAPANRFTCSDPALPTDGDNLVRRAVEVFHGALAAARPGSVRAWRIHLHKRIPAGAGLGGGSADAAATLRGLNGLYGRPFDTAALLRLAGRLGSDVPFLVEGGTARVEGRGECLTPLRWEGPAHYVLVFPGVAVATAWAYGQLHPQPDLTAASPYVSFCDSLKRGGRVTGPDLFSILENDFQALVERANPIVATAGSALMEAGARYYSMSGSGSTVFGIYDDRNAAIEAAEALKARGFRSFFCAP